MGKIPPFMQTNKEYESPLGEYRLALGLTVEELAKKTNSSTGTICGLQNGLTAPYFTQNGKNQKIGQIRPEVLKMCELFECDLEDLFPRYICDIQRYNSTNIRDCYTDEQLIDFHGATTIMPDPETLLSQKELAQDIDDTLNSLDTFSRLIIKMRFGFLINGKLTLAEAGKCTNTTKENIRQKETRALRTLKHPLRSKKLKEHYEDYNILGQDYSQAILEETLDEKLMVYKENEEFFKSIDINKITYLSITDSKDWLDKVKWINNNYEEIILQKEIFPHNTEKIFDDEDWKYNIEWTKENYRDTQLTPETLTKALKQRTIKTLEKTGFSAAQILGIYDSENGPSKIDWIKKNYSTPSNSKNFIKEFDPWQVTSLMIGYEPFKKINWLCVNYESKKLTPQAAIDYLFEKNKKSELKYGGKPPTQYKKNTPQ